MKDKIRLPIELGQAIQRARKEGRLKATDIASRSGRARNVLYRLERGEDVTLASLFDILRAMDLTISLERLGMPTLEEVTQRFGQDEDEDDDAS